MISDKFNYSENDLKFFNQNISYLIEYFYKNFYLILKKYFADIATQLIVDKKIECKQFTDFVENSIIKEAKIQEKNLKYINTNISNNVFIKNNILGDIDIICNRYKDDIDHINFNILNLNSIFYENFYGQLLEYCGLKSANYNKFGFKDIAVNDIVDKLVSSLKVSVETKKRIFKDITQKLNKSRNKKFMNNKQLNTKNIGTEKIAKKEVERKNKNAVKIPSYNDLNKKKLKSEIKGVKNDIVIQQKNLNDPSLIKDKKYLSKKEHINEKIKNKNNLVTTESKPQNINFKVKNNKINFNVLNPFFRFNIDNVILKNGLRFSINAAKNFGKIITDINNRINDRINGIINNKIVNYEKNKNTIENENRIIISNGEKSKTIVTVQHKAVSKKEIYENQEKLNKIKNAREDLDNRMQESKINGIGGIK